MGILNLVNNASLNRHYYILIWGRKGLDGDVEAQEASSVAGSLYNSQKKLTNNNNFANKNLALAA
jgi:hypothetical protein